MSQDGIKKSQDGAKKGQDGTKMELRWPKMEPRRAKCRVVFRGRVMQQCSSAVKITGPV